MGYSEIVVRSDGPGAIQARDEQNNVVGIHWAEGKGEAKTTLRPMEMILAGLGGCLLATSWPILEKMRQAVTAYEIVLHGERAPEPPRVYRHIHVEHRLQGTDLDRDQVQRAIELAEQYCSASAMLSRAVEIRQTFTILAGDA
ncbi:MAG: OsmC family protein [Chloroflexi bacterium]|nr:OsmC family protein [Chloroflexota bacterium]